MPTERAHQSIFTMPKPGRNAIVLLLAAATLIAGLAACTTRIERRGIELDPDMLRRIEPGVSDREDVRDKLGSPSSQASFGGETWYYISALRKHVAFYAPEVTDQKVIAIDFDEAGVVKSVRRYGAEDAREIEPVERTTATGGRELTILEQMFGNLGRLGRQTPQ